MLSDETSSLISQFKTALERYDINSTTGVETFASTLDGIASDLAKNRRNREEIGSDVVIWLGLLNLWRDLAHTQLTFWEDTDDEDIDANSGRQTLLRRLCTSAARFTRNLVAETPRNQERAFENEPDIRRLLHYYTSWSIMESGQVASVTRVLTQALSNLVTANDNLIEKFWEIYMNLSDDQMILIRLLSSKDIKTVLATLVLILNCTKGNEKRLQMLCRAGAGSRLCIAMLDSMVHLSDAAEQSDGARAFDIEYEIFSQLIEYNQVPSLYSVFSMVDQAVTPHQTTLLKIVDSYLQSKQGENIFEVHLTLSPILAHSFLSLSSYSQSSISRSLKFSITSKSSHLPTSIMLIISDTTPDELDTLLPRVCEALVLLTQCLVTISLETEETGSGAFSEVGSKMNLKDFFNRQQYNGQNIVESLIELLRLLDQFLPRINFGKPVISMPLSSEKTLETRHESTGFSYLKRDLVRLLGVLCHRDKKVQDCVRRCGGIPVVMNLCVIDERNPYLKEHAIFTLHNLLEDNLENQKVVDAIGSDDDGYETLGGTHSAQ
ncbi:hypothetical protein AMATHDRAFT_74613 [Amanita thiersii Skay4041]|uniref:Ataxin-10 homolog n=1 Tax=Amanita thiersii Skay4041 TaxID=703135 RepID=A0A2A9NW02_9AGAR|nr:hypothetical protein AMATHDRAFT_74613 [Amanita thiersii Skay4041]